MENRIPLVIKRGSRWPLWAGFDHFIRSFTLHKIPDITSMATITGRSLYPWIFISGFYCISPMCNLPHSARPDGQCGGRGRVAASPAGRRRQIRLRRTSGDPVDLGWRLGRPFLAPSLRRGCGRWCCGRSGFCTAVCGRTFFLFLSAQLGFRGSD